MGVLGTVLGIFLVTYFAYDWFCKVGEVETLPLMTDEESSRPRLLDYHMWSSVHWSGADTLGLVLVVAVLVFSLVFIVLGSIWTFGEEGLVCREQAPALWWHCQSFLIATWVTAGVIWIFLAVFPSMTPEAKISDI